jgi:hypothetical protein
MRTQAAAAAARRRALSCSRKTAVQERRQSLQTMSCAAGEQGDGCQASGQRWRKPRLPGILAMILGPMFDGRFSRVAGQIEYCFSSLPVVSGVVV